MGVEGEIQLRDQRCLEAVLVLCPPGGFRDE